MIGLDFRDIWQVLVVFVLVCREAGRRSSLEEGITVAHGQLCVIERKFELGLVDLDLLLVGHGDANARRQGPRASIIYPKVGCISSLEEEGRLL